MYRNFIYFNWYIYYVNAIDVFSREYSKTVLQPETFQQPLHHVYEIPKVHVHPYSS